MLIAIALGAGMTGDEAAAFAGVDRSTVFARKGQNANKEFIETWVAQVKRAVAEKMAIETEAMRSRHEAMYEKAVKAVEETISDPSMPILRYQAADKWIDRKLGKPTQRVEETKTVHKIEERRVIEVPGDVIRTLVGMATQTARMLQPALALPAASEEGAVEAEIEEDDRPAGS
jgi:hypothetical protein